MNFDVLNKNQGQLLVLTVGFCGQHVCEQQQAGVFGEAAEEGQPAQQQLRQPLGETTTVKVEICAGHQITRRWVQADAAMPDVALGYAADGGADGREVVWYLIGESKDRQTDTDAYYSFSETRIS